MAENVDYVFRREPGSHRGGRTNYKWDEWFNGMAWKLTQGIDFHLPVENFKEVVRTIARRKGKKIVYEIDDLHVFVKAVSDEPLQGQLSGQSS